MGNQHLAAGKAWFRMTSPDGKKFVPGKTAAYADLFTFNNLAKDKVILRPGVTLSPRTRCYRPRPTVQVRRFEYSQSVPR
jgi:hypothetical protein